MQRLIDTIYAFSLIAFGFLGYLFFPVFNTNVIIPVFPLLAVGTWLYGRTIAYQLTLLTLFYHYFLNVIYADTYAYPTDRIIGPVLAIVVVYSVDHLRRNLLAIKESNRILDQLVEERTVELANLTAKLLDENESARIRRGEELHDGMGQQLTGIRLLSSSLHEQFLDEGDAAASYTDALRNHTMTAHNQIRRVSRMLFPIRIGQVGLIPALNELAASIMEIKPIEFNIEELDELPPLPGMTSLQLYRICQETSIHAIDRLGASRVVIRIGQTRSDYLVGIEHDGKPQRMDEEKGPFELIQYRLKQISGDMRSNVSTAGLELTTYNVPKKAVSL